MATNLSAYLLANFCDDVVVTSPPLRNIREVYCRRSSSDGTSNNSRDRHMQDASSKDVAAETTTNGDVLIGSSPAKKKDLFVDDKRSDRPLKTSSTFSCRRKTSNGWRSKSEQEKTCFQSGGELNIPTGKNIFMIEGESYIEDYFSLRDNSRMEKSPVDDRLHTGTIAEGRSNDRSGNTSCEDGSSRCDSAQKQPDNRSMETLPKTCDDVGGVDDTVRNDPLRNYVGAMPSTHSSSDTGFENVVIRNKKDGVGMKENETTHDWNDIENSQHLISSDRVYLTNSERMNPCPPPKSNRGAGSSTRGGGEGAVVGHQDIALSKELYREAKKLKHSRVPDLNETAVNGTLPNEPLHTGSESCKEVPSVQPHNKIETFHEQESQLKPALGKKNSIKSVPDDPLESVLDDSLESVASAPHKPTDEQNALSISSGEDASRQDKQPDVSCDPVNPSEDGLVLHTHRDSSKSSSSDNGQLENGRRKVLRSESLTFLEGQRDDDKASLVNIVTKSDDRETFDDSRRSPARDSASKGHLEDDESTFPSLVSSDSGVYTPICDSFREESSFPTPFRLSEPRMGGSDHEEYDSIQSELLFSLTESVDGSIASFNEVNNPMSGRMFQSGETGALSLAPDYWARMCSGNRTLLSFGSDESIDRDQDLVISGDHLLSREYSSIHKNGLVPASRVDSNEYERSGLLEKPSTTVPLDRVRVHLQHDTCVDANSKSVESGHRNSGEKMECAAEGKPSAEAEAVSAAAACPPQLTDELKNAIRRAMELERWQLEKQERRKTKRNTMHGNLDDDVYEAMEEDVSSNDEEEDIDGGGRNEGCRNEGIRNKASRNEGSRNEGCRNEGSRNEASRKEGSRNEGSRNEGCRNEGCRNEASRNEGSRNEGCRNEGSRNEASRNEGSRNEGSRNEGCRNEASRNEGTSSKEKFSDVSSEVPTEPDLKNYISNTENFRSVGTSEEVNQRSFINSTKTPTPPNSPSNGVRPKDKGVDERGIQHSIHPPINPRGPKPTRTPEQTLPSNMASLIQTLKERGQRKLLPPSQGEDEVKSSLLDDYLLIRNKISSLLSNVKDMSRTAQENRSGFTALQQRTNNISVERDGLLRLRDTVLNG